MLDFGADWNGETPFSDFTKLVEVYEKSEYGRVPVQSERKLLETLGGVWIDKTYSKWTQIK